MKRFFMHLRIEFLAWSKDPITILGGFIPTLVMLFAFGMLFGGDLSFKIAFINHDSGKTGIILRETFTEVISPLNRQPYYQVQQLSEEEAWQAFAQHRIDGVWVVPEDFSNSIAAGKPQPIEMHFSNYNDDRAKNHRIYSSEILWVFYQKIGLEPPLELSETHTLSGLMDWFPIIAVGLIQLSAIIGGMMNMFMLTHKEKIGGILQEVSTSPHSLLPFLMAKVFLAFIMSLITGTGFMFIVYLWIGYWPTTQLPLTWLYLGLGAIFWIFIALMLGLKFKAYMAGAVITILMGILMFFISGGLNMVRGFAKDMVFLAWFFPNMYAVDPLRDLILQQSIPADVIQSLLILFGFMLLGGSISLGVTSRAIRRQMM
ncbi:MAG: ABC transporter permease [Anaerolineaceae bacterium]|nr:ABC transporter permease [Anaerolineaceae bacterium]